VVRTREAVMPEALPARQRLELLGPYVDSKGAPVNANLVDDPFYSSTDFVRFREIAVTYTLPSTLAQKLRVSRANITFGGRNLGLWTHYTGSDPETISDNVGLSDQFATTEFFNFPTSRRFFLRLYLDY
jgi:hypothetical protein